MVDKDMPDTRSSPFWDPKVHADRRPALLARGRIVGALRAWFAAKDFVEVETEPTIKSQTAASSYKPAVLSNGVRTMVPSFVSTGTKIVVMTADGSYVERAKD